MKVYLVEDNAFLAGVLAAHIEELGFDICGHSGNESEAIKDITCSSPDIVILDMYLDDGLGLNVMKAIDGMPAKPIVYVHSNVNPEDYSSYCIELGADKFFSKDNQTEDMLEELQHLAVEMHNIFDDEYCEQKTVNRVG